jgi:aldose 1-epimerase
MTDNLRPSPALTVTQFGRLADGRSIELYRLRTADVELSVSTYGGRIVTLYMIGPDGERTNVVLGFDSLQDYIADSHYVGALIGRYANRIARGKFRIGDKLYQVSTNEGDHSLHGGRCGFIAEFGMRWRVPKVLP